MTSAPHSRPVPHLTSKSPLSKKIEGFLGFVPASLHHFSCGTKTHPPYLKCLFSWFNAATAVTGKADSRGGPALKAGNLTPGCRLPHPQEGGTAGLWTNIEWLLSAILS
jgi:hypothetical protein